jgi:tetratricopeptide (TPR) repeat protein
MDAENLDFVAPTETVPVAEWETPLLLADMLAYIRKPDEAIARYAALSAEFPDRPEIDESRGYLEFHQLDREAAAKHFREAARKKSGNSMLYYQLAATACDYYVANEECRGWINEALRLDPANKQARQWAVGYALNAKDFDGAIVYLVRGGPVAASEAPEFFHKLAYAQYAKGNFKEARAAAKRGLEFARKPEDQQRLINLERNITAGEQYAATLREVREGTPAGGAIAAPGTAGPAQGNPAPQGNVRKGIGAEAARRSPADYAVEQFILEDGAVMTAATMEAMECGGAQPKVLVKAKGALLRLVVDNPSAVIVIRDGEVVVNHEFVCGKQKPVALLVGYLKGDAPEGSDGRLRILSFQ